MSSCTDRFCAPQSRPSICLTADGISWALILRLVACRRRGEVPEILVFPARAPAFLWFIHILPFIRLPNHMVLVQRLAAWLCPGTVVTWLADDQPGPLWRRAAALFTHETLSQPVAKDRSGVLAPLVTEALAEALLSQRTGYSAALRGLFFGDPDITFALRKRLGEAVWEVLYSYFAALGAADGRRLELLSSRTEDCMILAEASAMGAIDPSVSIVDARIPVLGAMLYQLSAFITNLLVLPALFVIPLRSLRTGPAVAAGRYKIGFINNQTTARTDTSTPETAIFGDVTFPVDDHTFHVNDIVVIGVARDGGRLRYADAFARAKVACFDPVGARLPWVVYRDLFLRRLPYALALIGLSLAGPRAALGVSLVPRMLRESLWWAKVCANVGFKTYLCVEEHSFSHVVKTVLFRQFGSHNVFFPNAILSRHSNSSSFYAYDLLMTAGAHLPRAYGAAWKQSMPVVPVGIMKNDTAAHCGEGYGTLSSPGFEALIGERRAAGQRIISFILGSVGEVEFSKRHNLRLVRMAAEILARHSDVTVIIKPKSTSEAFFRTGAAAEILAPFALQNRAHVIDHRREGGTLCSVQCLALASEACIFSSALGQPVSSAWVEVQMMGRPAFGFTPSEIPITTPGLEPFNDVLLFREEAGLLAALDGVLGGTWQNPLAATARINWDAWCDGQGRQRIIRTLDQLIEQGPDFLRRQPTVRDYLTASGPVEQV